MKKLLSFAVVCAVSAMTAAASAQAPPAPAPEGEAVKPMPVAAVAAGDLYDCVKYKDLDEMSPCAVPMIVEVPEPRRPCCHRAAKCCAPVAPKCAAPVAAKCCAPAAASCCAPPPRCVMIQICVPPCGSPCVKVSKSGDKIRYDYGKYAVDIRIKKGYIEVDYQD